MASNEKFHVTLSQEDGIEIKQRADSRGVPAVQIIREMVSTCLHQDNPSTTQVALSSSLFIDQLQDLTEQMQRMEQAIAVLSTRPLVPPITDPHLRTLLQPFYTQLQRLETKVGMLGNMMQQNHEQTLDRMKKDVWHLELWIQAVYTILHPILVDWCSDEVERSRKLWLAELQDMLLAQLEETK